MTSGRHLDNPIFAVRLPAVGNLHRPRPRLPPPHDDQHLLAEHSEMHFQLSRRDREFLPFSLMLRGEIESFCLSVSCFETRMRIFSYNLMFRDESEIFCHQSRASRRDREFLPFSLMLRDEIENFCLSVSFFETRMRISVFTLVLRDENNVEKNVLLLGDGFPYFYV